MKLFKIVASRGGEVLFDARIEAETPREARTKMKEALGIQSLTGFVYAITEIPMELIREIVAAHFAEITTVRRGSSSVDVKKLVSATVKALTGGALAEMEQRLERLEGRSGSERPTRRFDPLAAVEPAPANPPEEAVDDQPDIPEEPASAEIRPIPSEIRAILGPDWAKIKVHYRRTRSIKQTAAKFNVSPNTLKARIRREGWGK